MAITIVAPPPEQPIARNEDLQVFITASAPALKRAVITLEFPGLGRSEQVNNSAAALPAVSGYQAPYLASLRVPYTDGTGTGFQFIIRRDFGWPDNPIVHVVAYDTAGGEAIL